MKPIILNKRKLFAATGLILALFTLAACGDTPTATAIPLQSVGTTTAAAGSSTNNGTPVAGRGNGNNGTPGANGGFGNFSPPVTGTVESYDASAKSLTVKETNGTSQKFDITNARITKSEKITVADLAKLTLSNETLQFVGEKGSDGTYNATSLNVLDQTAFAGGPDSQGRGFGQNGTPQANATPPAAGQQPGQNQGQLPPNVTPGQFPGGRGGNFQGGNILRNATLSGNKLTGTDLTGAQITVVLADNTPITRRVAGTADDLKAGVNVSVQFRQAQGGTSTEAVSVSIS